MKHWIALNASAARDAFLGLFRQPVGTLLILLMLGIAITLPLMLYLGMESVRSILGNLATTPQITVYMDIHADSADSEVIEKTLRADVRIASVRFIGKDQALSEMRNNLGDADIIAMTDENPLPDAFVVTAKNNDPVQIEALQQSLNSLPMVETAQLDARWLHTLHDIEIFMRRILWFLAVTLSLAFMLVAHNTIRLQTLSRKEEIEITKLLGAPASFIRRPFVYLALWQGILSLAIGLGLCAWLFDRTIPQLSAILEPYSIVLKWKFFSWEEIGIVTLMIATLAVCGAWLAVRQHLHEYAARS